ncbi:universal stress protein A-like protein, partial [Tanacetum coccineum]
FDDVDSIYASPEDFRDANRKDKIKGARLLEYFVKRSHESGIRVSVRRLKQESMNQMVFTSLGGMVVATVNDGSRWRFLGCHLYIVTVMVYEGFDENEVLFIDED